MIIGKVTYWYACDRCSLVFQGGSNTKRCQECGEHAPQVAVTRTAPGWYIPDPPELAEALPAKD